MVMAYVRASPSKRAVDGHRGPARQASEVIERQVPQEPVAGDAAFREGEDLNVLLRPQPRKCLDLGEVWPPFRPPHARIGRRWRATLRIGVSSNVNRKTGTAFAAPLFEG